MAIKQADAAVVAALVPICLAGEKTDVGRAKKLGELTAITESYERSPHTFAARLVMAGVDLRTVQRPGGWPTLAMARLYAAWLLSHLHAAVDWPAAKGEVARRGVVQDTGNVTRRGGRARLKASDSKSDRGASPSGVQILSPPPN